MGREWTVEDVKKAREQNSGKVQNSGMWTVDTVKEARTRIESQKLPRVEVKPSSLKNNTTPLPTMGEVPSQNAIPVLKNQSVTNNSISDNIALFKNIASGNVKPNVSNEFEAKIAMGVNAANPEKYIAGTKEVPVTGDDRKWFQKGALEDGYQFGDVSKLLLGTYKDIEENAQAGAIGLGEKIVDAGAYIIGGAGGLLGADEFKNDMQKFIEKDLYDEEAITKNYGHYFGIPGLSSLAKNVVGDKADEYSVLGEKSDSLARSAGELAVTLGANAKIPGWLSVGTTSFGGEAQNAFKEGATYEEAGMSALITAGAEILTEKISGGIKFGGKTLDDKMTKAIADKISNKVVNAMAQTGVGALGEGGEEVLSGYMSAIGQKLTYMDDKEIAEIFSRDEALESFIGGVILGGGVTGVNQIANISNGTTQNLPETDAISTQTEVSASDVVNIEEKAQKDAEAIKNETPVQIKVGKATTITNPYQGIKPVQEKNEYERVTISEKVMEDVETNFQLAEIDSTFEGTKFSTTLQRVYEALFGNDGHPIVIPVENMTFEGKPYVVNVSKNSIGKIVSDGHLSKEKMAVINAIDEIIEKSQYVGSADFNATKNGKQKKGIRYDYFETSVEIAGEPYVVKFDVEVIPGVNNYRRHVILNEIDLTKATESDVETSVSEVPSSSVETVNNKTAAQEGLSSLSNNSIPNPEQTVNNAEMKVRGYNESIVEKTDLPEEVKNEFITNPQMYEVLKNKTTQEQAQTIIDNSTTEEAFARFNSLLDQKAPVSVPLGYYLSKKLIAEGRTDTAVEVLRSMSTKLTEAGQFTQAAAITLMQGDPVTALKYITRELDNLNAKGREQFKDKWKDFELTAEEKAAFSKLQPGDTEGIKAVYQSVFNRIQKEYPSSMKEKLLEYRRVAMLLNTRTNVRNVVSNALLMPVRWTTDRVSALGQNAIRLVNPDFQTTQAVVVDKKSKQLASEAWEMVKDSILETGNKYDDAKQAIRNKQVFKGTKATNAMFDVMDRLLNYALTKTNNIVGTRFDTSSSKLRNAVIGVNQKMGKDINLSLLETARNLTYWLLGKGDDVFVKKNFESRMASYIAAQKITDLESIPADAYTLATQEALKATFKDDTALASLLADTKKRFKVVGEVVLPFTKTPANLAMRGIDYSPAGLIRDVVNLARKENRTHADVTQAMDNMSKGVVGTAAIALGYILAKGGIISGALSDDKDEEAFQKKMGMLPYAIHIGDNYYTYDWAQPAAIPLILGATIYQSSVESDSAVNAWTQGALAASNAWLELSPLQNLQNIFGGYGTPMENLLGEVADLPSSLIPAQLGAISRVTDTTQRQTYSNGDFWGSRVNSAIAKIPVLNETLPASYDTWGNEVKRNNTTGGALFAQLISPGQLGNENVTPIDDEIMRLYNSTGKNEVFPKKAKWSYKVSGENQKLDNVTYSEVQKRMGQASYEMAKDFIDSQAYLTLSDSQRVSILSDLYGFAEALAKNEVLGYDITSDDDYKKYYKIYNDLGLQYVAKYEIYRLEADANKNNRVSGGEAENYLKNETIPRLQKSYWFETLCPTNKNNPFK